MESPKPFCARCWAFSFSRVRSATWQTCLFSFLLLLQICQRLLRIGFSRLQRLLFFLFPPPPPFKWINLDPPPPPPPPLPPPLPSATSAKIEKERKEERLRWGGEGRKKGGKNVPRSFQDWLKIRCFNSSKRKIPFYIFEKKKKKKKRNQNAELKQEVNASRSYPIIRSDREI